MIMPKEWGIPKKWAHFSRRAVEPMPLQNKGHFSRQEKAIFSFKIAIAWLQGQKPCLGFAMW